ncbi:MAG: TM1812 family CRISPR-associated protein [Thermoanaerobaculum sp.]|nr:TM1812 family CRISPR-associated protein [Thermoanaerobaculum sp.]
MAEETPAGSEKVLKHVLLINLGRGNTALPPPHYEQTTYVMPDEAHITSRVAGLALWRWLEDTGRSPESVLFACTDTAWEDKGQAVADEARALSLPFHKHETVHHEVPRSLNQLWSILPPLEAWLARQGARRDFPIVLHMDLTHAFRAIPMAHSWLALYLARRGLAMVGTWGYGAFDPTQKRLTPYLDLSHFAVLAEWAEAVRLFYQRLDPSALARLLDPEERLVRKARAGEGETPPAAVRALIAAAKAAGPHLANGLPLEVGLAVRQNLVDLTEEQVIAAARSLIPPKVPLVQELFAVLAPMAVDRAAPRRAKRTLELSEAEISRQRYLVEAWLRAGKLDAALRAFRELMVNRLLLAWKVPPPQWLRREERVKAESVFHYLSLNKKSEKLSPQERFLAELWSEVANFRNPLAHAGMEVNDVNAGNAEKKLREEFLPRFDQLCADQDLWDHLQQFVGLVSPSE